MADPILLSPHDRSLTQGGAGDLSLYGVQADPIVAFAAADPEAPATDPLGSSVSGAGAQGTTGGGARPDIDPAEGTLGALSTQGDAIIAPTIIPATPTPIAPTGDLDVAGLSNGPTGSATSPAILNAPDRAPEPADGLALAQPAAAMGAAVPAPVEAAGLVSVPMPVVQALMGSLGNDTGDLTAATDRVDAGTAVTTAAAAAVTATATVVADAIQATADTATGLTAMLGAATNEASAGVVAAASGPVMTVAPAASAAVDDALDLLGPDPAGGVATLVSLVTAADMFELSDAAPDGDGSVVAADDLLDSLAGDTPLPDALLGDAESGGGDALIPLPDDLPFG